jgi:hypothetical protein
LAGNQRHKIAHFHVNPLGAGIAVSMPFANNHSNETVSVSRFPVSLVHPLRQIHASYVFAFDSHRPAVCPNAHHVAAIITSAARHPIDTIIVKNLR